MSAADDIICAEFNIAIQSLDLSDTKEALVRAESAHSRCYGAEYPDYEVIAQAIEAVARASEDQSPNHRDRLGEALTAIERLPSEAQPPVKLEVLFLFARAELKMQRIESALSLATEGLAVASIVQSTYQVPKLQRIVDECHLLQAAP